MSAMLMMAWPGVAHAELRTADVPNRYPGEEPAPSSTRPGLDRAQLRLDTTTGTLNVIIHFLAPLAQPETTSALRAYGYEITLGNAYGTTCLGTDDDGSLSLAGYLVDGKDGALTERFDFDDSSVKTPVSEQLSVDRKTLMLSVIDCRLSADDLICADVELTKDNDRRYVSSTFGFLFDGVTRIDGDVVGQASSALIDEIQFFDRDLAAASEARKFWKINTRCRALSKATTQCSVRTHMRKTPGRPTLTLRGSMEYPDPYRRSVLNPRFRYDMVGRLSWRSCPKRYSRRLAGRPCNIKLRWDGTYSLLKAIGRPRPAGR